MMNAISPYSYTFLYPVPTFASLTLANDSIPDFLVNWRFFDDSTIIAAQNTLSDYQFTIMETQHANNHLCPKSGCRSYRRNDDTQTFHLRFN